MPEIKVVCINCNTPATLSVEKTDGNIYPHCKRCYKPIHVQLKGGEAVGGQKGKEQKQGEGKKQKGEKPQKEKQPKPEKPKEDKQSKGEGSKEDKQPKEGEAPKE